MTTMSTPASVSFNRIKKEDPVTCSPCSPSSSLPASTAYIDTTTVWDMEILDCSPLMSTHSSPVFPPAGGGLPATHRLGEILNSCTVCTIRWSSSLRDWTPGKSSLQGIVINFG